MLVPLAQHVEDGAVASTNAQRAVAAGAFVILVAGEAEQVGVELGDALDAFDVGEGVVGVAGDVGDGDLGLVGRIAADGPFKGVVLRFAGIVQRVDDAVRGVGGGVPVGDAEGRGARVGVDGGLGSGAQASPRRTSRRTFWSSLAPTGGIWADILRTPRESV